ncbi:hypothetical protein M9Y10_036337 [Tritrichomonas musculus]|uniref:c-Myc-binding protein n=1 Tax=Tritrichomonas musculus TaxID=1915356 RepID=A0ABR2GV42_9EUKA
MTESKRENFRKYLESGNVMEALTRALVSLYEEPEQPSDPLNYIRQSIGAGEGVDVDALVRRNQELKEEVASLTQQISEIEAKLNAQPV